MVEKESEVREKIELLLAGQVLRREEMAGLFTSLLSESTSEQANSDLEKQSQDNQSNKHILLASVLSALRVRGEQACELAGAVDALRLTMENPIVADEKAIDIVGTGGDGLGTFNISSATALVVASCGVSVAKHGNRSVSSQCGAADLLEALGININSPIERIQQCLDETNFCFMFAPRHHPAMAFAAKVRKTLASRTIFNLLGPLLNPAGVTRGLFGVCSRQVASLYAETLDILGFKQAWIVCGAGDADEMTLCGESQAIIIQDGDTATTQKTGMHKKRALLPADAELPKRELSLIRGGNAQYNAKAISKVFDNKCSKENSPERALFETILYNSAAALMVAQKTQSLLEGTRLAREAIEKGEVKNTLEKVKAITNSN